MTHVLVSVDTSDISATIVETAARVVARLNAKVTLLNVAPRQPDRFGQQLLRKVIEEPVPDELRERYDALQGLAQSLRGRGITCDTLMVRGKPVDTILSEAKRLDVDMIVMGSHGRGALYRNLLGSVSEGVLRAGRRPLLIIPHSDESDGVQGSPA